MISDPSFSGEPAIGRRHEASSLFMAGEYQLDVGGSDRLQEVEVLFSWLERVGAWDIEEPSVSQLRCRGDNRTIAYSQCSIDHGVGFREFEAEVPGTEPG